MFSDFNVSDESEIVAENLDFLLESGFFFLLGDCAIGVAHNGNEHIEDDNLRDE